VKPSWVQQALAGLAILFVVTAALAGGFLLMIGDDPLGAGSRGWPTPTPFRLPTLPPGGVAGVTPQTGVPPTVTLSPTDAPSDTPEPTPTNVPPPTSTPPLSDTPVPPQPTTTVCTVRVGWVPYTVQRGETLFRIALRYGLSTGELQRGNCLPDTSLIAGQTLYVPNVQPRPQPTSAPLPTATLPPVASGGGGSIARPEPGTTAGACTDPNSTITSPGVGAVISGNAPFYGTAMHPDLQFYKLEVRRHGTSGEQDFVTVHTGTEPVQNGLLGTVNTVAFENGDYWVRLVVVDSTGNYPERCSILYTFRN